MVNSSIYQTLYDTINTYIFGGSIVSGTYPELVTVLLSCIGCLFVFSLPFILVWKVCKWLGG